MSFFFLYSVHTMWLRAHDHENFIEGFDSDHMDIPRIAYLVNVNVNVRATCLISALFQWKCQCG